MGLLLDRIRRQQGSKAKLAARQKGSITLEASLAVPLILTFLLAMITFVELAQSEAGLRTAVYQSAQQLAIHAYPLDLLTNSLEEKEVVRKLQEWQGKYEDGKQEVGNWLEEYGPLIPEPVRDGVQATLDSAESLEDQLTEPIRRAFQPFVVRYLPDHMEQERLTITALKYPIIQTSGEPLVMIEAAYEVPVRLPFFTRTITLKAAAWERMWTGRQGN